MSLREALQGARAYEGENQTRVISKGKGPKQGYRDGIIEINGQRFPIFNRTIGYKQDRDMTPILELFIQANWHHNPTHRETIRAKTLRGLLSKINKHKYKLVRT